MTIKQNVRSLALGCKGYIQVYADNGKYLWSRSSPITRTHTKDAEHDALCLACDVYRETSFGMYMPTRE